MMQQASFEFGFEAEDIPLMIEAIPVNADCIVLIITKVEDPDEIDTRFSKFSPSLSAEDDAAEDDITDHFSDDVLDLFQKIKNSAGAVSNTQNEEPQTAAPRMLQAGLNHLCTFSRIVKMLIPQKVLYTRIRKQCSIVLFSQWVICHSSSLERYAILLQNMDRSKR